MHMKVSLRIVKIPRNLCKHNLNLYLHLYLPTLLTRSEHKRLLKKKRKSINSHTSTDGKVTHRVVLIAHVPQFMFFYHSSFCLSPLDGAFLNGCRSYLAPHAFCN